MRSPTHIMIHHSLTKDSGTVSWPAIEKFHVQTNGWSDIGYHAGVELVSHDRFLAGYGYQALMGRGLDQKAAACPQGNMNELALHVCCVGNYDLEAPSIDMLHVLLKRVLIPWSTWFNIPKEKWIGHRDYNTGKSCPGTKFDLNFLRQLAP